VTLHYLITLISLTTLFLLGVGAGFFFKTALINYELDVQRRIKEALLDLEKDL